MPHTVSGAHINIRTYIKSFFYQSKAFSCKRSIFRCDLKHRFSVFLFDPAVKSHDRSKLRDPAVSAFADLLCKFILYFT